MTTKHNNREINTNAPTVRTATGTQPSASVGAEGSGVNLTTNDRTQENGDAGQPSPERKMRKRTRATLTVASLNMKGKGSRAPLHPNNKWNILHQHVKERKIAIMALQETHLDEGDVDTLHDLYGRRLAIYASHAEEATKSKGVAIVINKDLVNIKDIESFEIVEGRAILLRIPWHGANTLSILAVYAPNAPLQNADFWRDIREIWRARNIAPPDIVLGDFNVVEDSIDRLPHHLDEHTPTDSLHQTMRMFKLTDGWRQTHPDWLDFSFPVVGRSSKSRIDRIYATNEIIRTAEGWTIETSPVPTDHKMITAQITHREAPFVGPGRWSMPLDLLKDKKFTDYLADRTTKLKADVCNTLGTRTAAKNPQIELATYKKEIVHHAREYLKTKVPKVKKALEKLNQDLDELKSNPDATSDESLNLTRRLIEEKIFQLQMLGNQSRRLATTARYRLEGETISRYWSAINRGRSPRDLIYSFRKPNTNPPEYERRSDRMAELAKDYHETLQDHSPPISADSRKNAIRTACASIDRVLTGNPGGIQYETFETDVKEAIDAADNGKAAGIDGIPYEVWKSLSSTYEKNHADDKEPPSEKERAETDEVDIVWVLTRAYNDVETFGICRASQFALGWLCPLYKKGDRSEVANYRPITLLNSDYKTLTKVLAMKLATAANDLIHEDQAGFVPGRSIFHQIRQAQLAVGYSEAIERNGVIIALDQEKAYDKIMHDYLWEVLEAFHLPPYFIQTVKNLYAEAHTVVMINGEKSKPFKVTRGVRQGCPLSCLIFNLAIEPLANMLRKSKLEGLEVPGLKERIITTLFADDTTAYLSANDSLSDLDDILTLWTEASGGKFNPTKMEVIPMGSTEYRAKVYEDRTIGPHSTPFPPNARVVRDGETARILGAWIGTDPDPNVSWNVTVNKISLALGRWKSSHPSLNGKRLVAQMVVGGMSQFLTKAQGMPPQIEKQLTDMIRDFVWDDKKQPPIQMETLYRPREEGGLKLLDIRARTAATHLTWLRDYLNFSRSRPTWAFIADALIALAIKKSSGNPEQSAKINKFIQTWDANLHSTKILPREILQMLRAGRKFGVRLDALKLTRLLKLQLPIWYHIGAEQRVRSQTNTPPCQCLRRVHGVTTVLDVHRVTERIHKVSMNERHRIQRHHRRKDCACEDCKADRNAGCTDPDRCCRAAKDLLSQLYLKYDPENIPPCDGLSLTPRRLEENEVAKMKDEAVLFNPSITDPNDLTQTIRVFSQPRTGLSIKAPSLQACRGRRNPQEITVYTDGSSSKNGSLDSRVGSGVWFGDNDTRNMSLRIGIRGADNQTGELVAILAAVRAVPPDAPLHIISDSRYAIDGLTTNLTSWEEKGWIGVKNRDIFQAIAARLRKRAAETTFKWVKGHAGVYGNEQADQLASEGARKEDPDEVDLTIDRAYLLSGAKLASLSQAMAYAGIKELSGTPNRKATDNMMERTRSAVKVATKISYPDHNIWRSIRSADYTKPVQDFLWKALHNAQKLGTYWSYIPECEDRILCHICEVEESLVL